MLSGYATLNYYLGILDEQYRWAMLPLTIRHVLSTKNASELCDPQQFDPTKFSTSQKS